MKGSAGTNRISLGANGTVAVIGGGPAGAFFAIHLLNRAHALNRAVSVVIFERRWRSEAAEPACATHRWKGCNYCAGGVSPRLNDELERLDLKLPDEVVQSRIHSITVQGYWKNIEFEVPAGRKMFSVYRGSRPGRREDRHHSFDSFLLSQAVQAGARLISGEVEAVTYSADQKPVIQYRAADGTGSLEADFAVFANGVNELVGRPASDSAVLQSLQQLLPDFVPPQVRRALVFELECPNELPPYLAGVLHFVEYGSKELPVEMCSLVPKRGFLTAVLMGTSVDKAVTHAEYAQVMKRFIELPHIRKLLSPNVRLHPVCICNPNIVVGTAVQPFGDRVAAVGDMVTSRLYKDGMLTAHRTACALAETILTEGVDRASLRRGYGPAVQHFRWDNRFAAIVFLLHRVFFSSSMPSRILYQAVISERKTKPVARRRLEGLLWQIASGDDEYQTIFLAMIHPVTMARVFTGGALTTLRNHLAELVFGLRWEGFGRFTTGVAKERLDSKRVQFASLIAESHTSVEDELEFESMYTIRVRAPRAKILEQLGRFGEQDRGYFQPRWVTVRRVQGEPNQPGCVIQYEVMNPRLRFRLRLEQIVGGHLAVYRVMDGFAEGGVLVFEIEKLSEGLCDLSIYVAFNFTRGRTWLTRPFWWAFRLLFPAFLHDVIWNHSLCQFKDTVETQIEEAPPMDMQTRCSCATRVCASAG